MGWLFKTQAELDEEATQAQHDAGAAGARFSHKFRHDRSNVSINDLVASVVAEGEARDARRRADRRRSR